MGAGIFAGRFDFWIRLYFTLRFMHYYSEYMLLTSAEFVRVASPTRHHTQFTCDVPPHSGWRIGSATEVLTIIALHGFHRNMPGIRMMARLCTSNELKCYFRALKSILAFASITATPPYPQPVISSRFCILLACRH